MTREETGAFISAEGPSIREHYSGDYYRGWAAGMRDAADVADKQGAFLYSDTGAKAAHGAWSARDEIRKAVEGENA